MISRLNQARWLCLTAGLTVGASLVTLNNQMAEAAPQGRQATTASSNSSTPKFENNDVKIVESALSLALTDEQKTAVTNAANTRDTTIRVGQKAFSATVKSIYSSSAALTDSTKKASVDTAVATVSSVMQSAKVAYMTSVAKSVDQPVADVTKKIDEYVTGQSGKDGKDGKGGKGGGDCKGKGGGTGTSGGTSGGSGSGTTTGSTSTTGGSTYGS